MDNAIFYNGELDDTSNSIVGSSYSIAPPQTNIVFSYGTGWNAGDLRPIGRNWTKPNREYIVFLYFFGIDAVGSWAPVGSFHKVYYQLCPSPQKKSYGIYPIEDGNVIDEGNAMGLGTSVPVDVFKQHIRNVINQITNYGE